MIDRWDTAEPSSARRARSPLLVDVALVPGLVPAAGAARRRTAYIVVDVIRATTTLCVQFERGCAQVLVAGSIAAARAAADLTPSGADGARPLLAGEVEGVAPRGFDHGNSPAEFSALDLSGQTILFATTNGTRALHAAAGGAHVLVGSLRNCAAAAHLAATLAARTEPTDAPPLPQPTVAVPSGQPDAPASEGPAALAERNDVSSVTIVCSGRGERPAYDDTVCAGYLVAALRREADMRGHQAALGEGAHIALAVADSARRVGLRAALEESEAGRAVASLGLLSDLDWCAAVDATSLVPVVRGALSQGDLLIVEPWAGPF